MHTIVARSLDNKTFSSFLFWCECKTISKLGYSGLGSFFFFVTRSEFLGRCFWECWVSATTKQVPLLSASSHHWDIKCLSQFMILSGPRLLNIQLKMDLLFVVYFLFITIKLLYVFYFIIKEILVFIISSMNIF